MQTENETPLLVGSDAIVLPLRGWHHDRSQYADWGWIRDDAGNLVADVKVPRGCDEAKHRREKTDPTEAISKLIAASPRMLDALKIAKAEFEQRDGAGTCPTEIEDLLEEIFEQNVKEHAPSPARASVETGVRP